MSAFPSRLIELKGTMSVNRFARFLGVHQQTLNNYVLGRAPSVDFIITVCQKCGVSADWLLGLTASRDGPGIPLHAVNSAVAINGNATNNHNGCQVCPFVKAAEQVGLKRKRSTNNHKE